MNIPKKYNRLIDRSRLGQLKLKHIDFIIEAPEPPQEQTTIKTLPIHKKETKNDSIELF